MLTTQERAIEIIYRNFRDPALIGQINSDFDGCWGLQVSAALAEVTPRSHQTFFRTREATDKRLVVNTGRPGESLIYSLNRHLMLQALANPTADHLYALNDQFIIPRAVCEMGTVFISRQRCQVVGSEQELDSGSARLGLEFLPCQIAEAFHPIRIDAAPTFEADEKKGELALLKRVREVLQRMDDSNYEFEPKRHTVTLHSRNGKTSADSQQKLINVMGLLVRHDHMKITRDGKIVRLEIPHFTDNEGGGTRYEGITIKITQGHNVADALPFGLDKTSATHAIMNHSHARHGKPIFSVTVGDSPVDALITRGVMSSPYYAGKFCIRVGNTPFDPADEANVDLVIPGDKAEAVQGFVAFMDRVARKLDGTDRTVSIPAPSRVTRHTVSQRNVWLRARSKEASRA